MPYPKPPSCSFCGSSQQQVKHLIAGTHVYICDRCVRSAHTVIAGRGETASTPITTIQQIGHADQAQCSFCGKQRHKVAGMAAVVLRRPGPERLAICHECLELCDEIISEHLDEPRS